MYNHCKMVNNEYIYAERNTESLLGLVFLRNRANRLLVRKDLLVIDTKPGIEVKLSWRHDAMDSAISLPGRIHFSGRIHIPSPFSTLTFATTTIIGNTARAQRGSMYDTQFHCVIAVNQLGIIALCINASTKYTLNLQAHSSISSSRSSR